MRRVMRFVAVVAALCVVDTSVARAQTADPPQESQATRTGFQISPRGYVQLDWRGYSEWPVTPGTGRLAYDTFEVRRARVGVDGTWGRRFSYEFTVDPQDLDDTLVRDAYGRWRVTRTVQVQVGQFKVPGSRDYLASARNMTFMERSALAQFAAAGRDVGAMVEGDLGRVEYSTGVFAGDGRGRDSRAGVTSASRVVWGLVKDVDVAGAFTIGRTNGVDDQPANGIEGRTSTGYRFFERVYVDGRRTRFGGDVVWSPGPWRIVAEALRVSDARDGQGLEFEDLPSVNTVGYSASVVRRFGRSTSGRPRARLREFDLGARFDGLDLDDSGPDTSRASTRPRATDIRARGARSFAATAAWQPTRWSRVLAHLGYDRFTDARSAPEAGRAMGYWTTGARMQFELP
jgi:phosphate-selective porin